MSRSYGVPSRRKQVIELLTDAYARNDLEEREFENRVERAEQAATIEELDELVADFPHEVLQPPAQAAPRKVQLNGAELQREVDKLDGMAAPTRFNVLGDQHITITPADPAVIRSVSLIGDCDIDLLGLSGAPGVFLVKVASLLGDTRIIVPRGTRVEFRMANVIGDQERTKSAKRLKRIARKLGLDDEIDRENAAPGPTVVVMGFKVIGDTQVVEL